MYLHVSGNFQKTGMPWKQQEGKIRSLQVNISGPKSEPIISFLGNKEVRRAGPREALARPRVRDIPT